MDAVQIHTNNIPNLPVEILESEYPIRVLKFELVPDSGGAGQFRGGLATRKDFLMLSDIGYIAHADRHDFSPWPMGGGEEGARGIHLRDPGQPEETRLASKGGPFDIPEGHTLRCQSAGAGGYGNPAERDAESLAEDLADAKITLETARSTYPPSLVEIALRRMETL
jgi:N-methylhydantoinase B